MNSSQESLDRRLDEALESLRAQTMPEDETRAAADRVRQLLRQEPAPAWGGPVPAPIQGCDDFQALIPAYLAEELPEARRLLLEDHSRACIPCRKALALAREAVARQGAETSTASTAEEPSPASGGSSGRLWLRLAASVVLVAGLGIVLWTLLGVVPLPWGQTAKIQELEGELFRLTPDGYIALHPGDDLPFDEAVRSAKDSGAVVRLEDGTRIELASRSEMELTRRRKGTIVELGRGNIIVEAAKQRNGKLYVSTDDCLVSVTGTIFSVNAGLKGSRVSVVEGEVVVDYGAQEAVLNAGQQVSTHPSVGPVPVAREIAWSRNVDEYLELLGELQSLKRDLEQAIGPHELRYSTELLDLMPAGAVFYAGIPNLSNDLSEAYEVLQERIASSPALSRWWREDVGHGEADPALETALSKVTDLGRFLGPEIALGLKAGEEGAEGDDRLLIVSRVLDRAGLRALLAAELAELPAAGDRPEILLVEDLRALPAGASEADLLIWVGEELVAVASGGEPLKALGAVIEGEPNPFVPGRFRQRLAEVYADGADWLVGADMETILASSGDGERSPVLEASGILDVEHLVLERKPGTGNQVHHRAVLSFDGPRRGMASWLAHPAPMASLEFVSPDAYFVTAVLAKEPEQLADDLFGLLDTVSPKIRETIERFEREQGLRIVDDFAAPLGGEMAMAIDGPVLPTLSWKVVLEVYDAARLQNTIEELVARTNEATHGENLRLSQGTSGGRPVYTLSTGGGAVELSYTYADGYLVAGPTRAVLDRAVQYRDSGYSLPRSPTFMALLPADGHANFSAVTYQNAASLLGPLAQRMSGSGAEELDAEQRQKFQEIVSEAPATLACAYGEEDRIIFVGNSEEGFLSGLLGLSGAISLEHFKSQLQGLPQQVSASEA